MSKNFFLACLASTAVVLLSSCTKLTSSESTQVGEHRIVIIDTSGHGGSSVHDFASGTEIFTHDGGHCKVRLENEVLTVNGKTYAIPNEDDSILIEDGRVQLNGRSVEPAEQ